MEDGRVCLEWMQQAIKTMFGFRTRRAECEHFEALEVTMPDDRRENKGGNQQGGKQPQDRRAKDNYTELEPDTRRRQSSGKPEPGENQEWSDRESKSGRH